jgi:probable F420-dependent oxidoreductase
VPGPARHVFHFPHRPVLRCLDVAVALAFIADQLRLIVLAGVVEKLDPLIGTDPTATLSRGPFLERGVPALLVRGRARHIRSHRPIHPLDHRLQIVLGVLIGAGRRRSVRLAAIVLSFVHTGSVPRPAAHRPRLAAVKIGVILPASDVDGGGTTPAWSAIRSFALGAEERGLDSVWMYDHFFNEPQTGTLEGQHEAWTIVSAVAAVTGRLQIGTLVLCTGFRNPGIVAKMAATADDVSGGRLILGLGAGWHDPEYRAFGYPIDHRVDRFEESLEVIAPLLRGERVDFSGRHHQMRGAIIAPAPSRRIPILVAAFGPRMLRLAARHADAWNTAWYGAPDDRLTAAITALDGALTAEGRDPATLARTVGMIVVDPEMARPNEDDEASFAGSVDELAGVFDAYAGLGVDHLVVILQPMTEASLDRLAAAVALRRG